MRGEKADTYLLNNFTKQHIAEKDGKEEKPQIKLFVFYVRRTWKAADRKTETISDAQKQNKEISVLTADRSDIAVQALPLKHLFLLSFKPKWRL